MLNKRGLAVSQIFILIMSIIAFGFLIDNMKIISAAHPTGPNGEDLTLKGASSAANLPTGSVSNSYAMWALKHIAPEFAKKAAGFSTAGIIQGAGWALLAYGITKMVGGLFGLDPGLTNALASSAAWGIFAGKAAASLFAAPTGTFQGGVLAQAFPSLVNTLWVNPYVIGAAVAVAVFISMFSNTKIKIINFTCHPWDAKTGGSDCEKCNKQGLLSCSEYQCRSLGQACQLLNPGTENAKCTWVNKGDVNPPIIKPNPSVLLNGYKYSPDNTISPPDSGVKIVNENSPGGCAAAFTPLSLGIELNEPAKCKIDYIRKNSFDNMSYYFGDNSMFMYNHTQALALPGGDNLAQENLTLENDGKFSLYVRCQDANGNANVANFVFKFCVQKGPDTTPPLIVSTNLLNGMPIAYNQSSIDLDLYVNEPSECRWSHMDKSYDDMEENFACSLSVEEMNAQLLYTCTTTLTGLKNNAENKFYFRCKDQPLKTSDRNVNTESYEFSLLGTQPLVINSVSPDNETIKDSTDTVKVTLEAKTSAGYNEGEAICYYSSTGKSDDYIAFYNTTSYEHSQELWLPAGDYTYFIKCIDLGGNAETKEINFNVESDTTAPVVVRAYHEDSYLKLITNEKAECVYDTVDCSYAFDDGTSITTSDGIRHLADWDTKTNLYIKCRDTYGNEPQPQNTCSITVRAYDA